MIALKEGANLLGKSILEAENRPFEDFITIAYDNKLDIHHATTLSNYEGFISSVSARSKTNFVIVFEEIIGIASRYNDLKELTVIFFTDGCDTCNQKNALNKSLEFMTEMIRSNLGV